MVVVVVLFHSGVHHWGSTNHGGRYPVLDSSGGRAAGTALYHIRSMYTILFVLTTQLHDMTNKKQIPFKENEEDSQNLYQVKTSYKFSNY